MSQLTHSTERGHDTVRRSETLRTLRDALMQLLADGKDFEAITVKDITNRANLDRTTFYLHAADKRDLYERSQQEVIDELLASTSGIIDTRERTRAAFRQLAEHATTYRALLSVSAPAIDQRLQKYMVTQITPTIIQRTGVSEAQGELMATFTASTLRTMARWWLEHDMPYAPDKMAEITQRLIEGGLPGYLASGLT